MPEGMDAESQLKRSPAVKPIKKLEEALESKSAQPPLRTREGTAKVMSKMEQIRKSVQDMKTMAVARVKEPEFQKLTISTSSGVIVLGAAGGAFGIASGVVIGSVAGLAPALATFGLSIPAGAMCGGVAGLLVGSTAGGTAGGASGFCLYKYRVQIKDGIVQVKVKACNFAADGYGKAKGAVSSAKFAIENKATEAHEKAKMTIALAKEKTGTAATMAKTKAGELLTLATTTRAGASSAMALFGSTVGSTCGGICGAVAGGAVGMVPAIFTFGLSIPIGAGIGLVAGAATGGGAGAVGGGAIGFAGITYQEEIKRSADYLRKKSMDSAEQVKKSVKSLVGAGTGESA
eukprot:Skav232777  [mRNA]  locus=scaffold614:133389:139205:- [translate_table: standard]